MLLTALRPLCLPATPRAPGFYQSLLLLLGDKPQAYNNIERVLVTALLFLGTLFYAIVVREATAVGHCAAKQKRG